MKQRWRRRHVFLSALMAVMVLGVLIRLLPGDWSLTLVDKGNEAFPSPARALVDSKPVVDRTAWHDVLGRRAVADPAVSYQVLFQHGLQLMQTGRLNEAAHAFELLLEAEPQPEGYVNLGFIRYDQQRFDEAKSNFLKALALNPAQGNGYYGLAIAEEALGDLEAALGAMRSFLHIAQGYDAYKGRARAALWEWETRLGRVSQTFPTASFASSVSILSKGVDR